MPTRAELIESILENIDLAFASDEEQDAEADVEDDEESSDEPELTEDDVEGMSISTLLDSVSPDVFIKLVNDELGDGVLSGTLKRDGNMVSLQLTYFDDSGEEEDVLLNDEREANVDDLDGLLDLLNESLDALVENLENDEGMVVL